MTDIVFKTVDFPDGFVGVPYEAAIGYVAPGGTLSAGAVDTGALPTGLAVNADHVRITGTPTVAGIFSFKLTLTDVGGAVNSGTYTIAIHTGDITVAGGRITEQADAASTVADDYAIEWPS